MSSPLATNHDINSMDNAVAAAIPTARLFCCKCPVDQNRCGTECCPCFAKQRMCDQHCESARYRGDCLSQAICKCSCGADPRKPAVCTKSEHCDCLRINESCSKLCACKKFCKNPSPKEKLSKSTPGCQCSSKWGKKQCDKNECQCQDQFEFCSSTCKCGGDCPNGTSKFQVPKNVQNCFLDHKNESSALIVTLIGDDFMYRRDFYQSSTRELHAEEQLTTAIYKLFPKYNVDLNEIVIFMSKSPCFHQDCHPICEIVDECRSNKACAKLLGLLLFKVRKELNKVDIGMTVKFLYPYLNGRGDLYTKQGILSMLQDGINVEPLAKEDWKAVMDWATHPKQRGEYSKLWGNHNLDYAVAQSQSFINECRLALGLPMKCWVAEGAQGIAAKRAANSQCTEYLFYDPFGEIREELKNSLLTLVCHPATGWVVAALLFAYYIFYFGHVPGFDGGANHNSGGAGNAGGGGAIQN